MQLAEYDIVGRKKLHHVRLANDAGFMWEWVEMLPNGFNAPVYERVTELKGRHSLDISFCIPAGSPLCDSLRSWSAVGGFIIFDCEDRFTSDGRKPPPLITSERPFGSN